jgi:hypothetical protein
MSADNDNPADASKKPAKRCSQAQLKLRIRDNYRILLQNGNFQDVLEYCQSEDQETGKVPWNYGERQVRRMMQKAAALFEKDMERDRNRIRARELAKRDHYAARALEQGDIRSALRASDSKCMLLGLFPSKFRKQPEQQASDNQGLVEELLACMSSSELRHLLDQAQAWLPPTLSLVEKAK